MPNFNSITILGRLTSDVETANNGSIGKFTLAVSEKYKDKENTSFIDCTVFDEKRTEILSKFVKKGSHLLVIGKIRQENWEKDGQKRSKLVVIVDNFQFIDPPQSNGEKINAPASKAAANKKVGITVSADEDIPF